MIRSRQELLKSKWLFILSILLIISALQSCLKSNDSNTLDISGLSVIHASPGLAPIDFYIDGNRINGDSVIEFTDTIPYKIINSGTATITVKKYISSTTYISKSIEFETGKQYSFFITGKPDTVKHLLIEDNMDTPASGKAKLRFINLSPDAPDLSFKLNSNTLFSGKAFQSYSEFNTVDPGSHTISIIDQTNGSTLTQQNLVIEAGKSYTAWAKGLMTTSDSSMALSIQVIGVQ